MTTTPLLNVVSGSAVLTDGLHVFSSWEEAKRQGYFTRNQWKLRDRRVWRKSESHAAISYKGELRDLFCLEQTSEMQPRTAAIAHLTDFFAPSPDIFGITVKDHDRCLQIPSTVLWGSPAPLIARGYRLQSCRRGIRVGRYLAEGFHVRAKAETEWCVIDLDNHDPTKNSTSAHLELLRAIQANLPDLLRWVGGGTVFYQYRSITPTGIQIYVVSHKKHAVALLHQKVRTFLLSLDNDGLNKRLKKAGLQTLDRIEILPTVNHCVSMPGIYGKSVFTDRELKPIPTKGFDAESLWTHISEHRPVGDVFHRYKELVEVGIRQETRIERKKAPNITAFPTNETPPAISTGRGYWSDLKLIALNGVTSPDNLFHDYLNRLATALYFRDFASLPNRRALTIEHLSSWILKKHNNLVSRINRGKSKEVLGQIERVVNRLDRKTSSSVKQFFSKVLANDQRFPRRVEYIWEYMAADSAEDVQILISCKGVISDSHSTSKKPIDTPLPNSLQKHIDQHFQNSTHRKGSYTDKRNRFFRRFINEIGIDGPKPISKIRVNVLMDLDPDSHTRTVQRHKKMLVEANILKPGWSDLVVRGKSNSQYELHPWVVALLKEREAARSSPPKSNRKPPKGRK